MFDRCRSCKKTMVKRGVHSRKVCVNMKCLRLFNPPSSLMRLQEWQRGFIKRMDRSRKLRKTKKYGN